MNENTDKKISDILLSLGVSPKLKGFNYLKSAISMYMADENLVRCFIKTIYPAVAEKFNTNASRVDRTIRYAIDKTFIQGNTDKINEIFGHIIDGNNYKVTNSQFIITIAMYIKNYM